MQLSVFDLHCDTVCAMHATGQSLAHNDFAVSLEKANNYRHYIQVMALWTHHRLSDEEGWERALAMIECLRKDPAVQSGEATLTDSVPKVLPSHPLLLLGLEDARILAGELSRVKLLRQAGVRIFTPLWAGETCIGGSHDTDKGLTDFGRAACTEAMELGMIPDISHASVASAEEIFSIAKEKDLPVIASHSNAQAVCPVSRNLSDDQVRKLLASGGLIGINLYREFLREDGNATVADILRHTDHFLSLGAEQKLSLGCDMDGAELPKELPNLAALPRLAEAMLAHGYSEELVHAIFFENANRFAARYLFE